MSQIYSYRMYSCSQLGFRTSYLDENKPLEYFEQKNDTVRFAFKKKIKQLHGTWQKASSTQGIEFRVEQIMENQTKGESSNEAGNQGLRG